MARQRIYELARSLGLDSKEVLERAQQLGYAVKTASSSLDEVEAAAVVGSLAPSSAPAAAEATVAEATVAEEAEEATPVTERPGGEAVAAQPTDDRVLLVEPGLTTHELARMIKIRTVEIVQALMEMGEMVPSGGTIPTHAIALLGEQFGYELLVTEPETPEPERRDLTPVRYVVEYEDDPSTLRPRPPVVTVMGHVDHGKTLLLDTIRKANVVEGEAGGITQHIGAYRARQGENSITFIDTPGHEAFTALRARGADVTDLVILVVAADDGVMPQTVEAIAHARAAEVPLIVAINKMDLAGVDPYAVRAALTQHDVLVEELGGKVPSVEVSALRHTGIDDLLEIVSLVAEVEELTTNPNAPAVGTVIEAQLEVGRGPVATVIVQRGTLRKGDAIASGGVAGRVRALYDDNGEEVELAAPSSPVLITGWADLPQAGDMFQVVKDERTARKLADEQLARRRNSELYVPTATERLGHLLESMRTADHTELRIIVKADAHGSLEAIRDAVAKVSREDATVSVIHGGVGGINANDVRLAEASNAIVYGFNTRPDASARAAAKEAAIDIRTFAIIYELLDDVEQLMVGELAPEEVESFLGVAEVRATFRAPRYGLIAGSYVTEGVINRNARARLVRDGVVVYDGKIASLRRFKDDVQQVQAGYECGIGLEGFRDIKEGDTIESYEVRSVART